MKLIDQVHELEIKAGEDGLSKEGFNSIVDKRNKLATQLDEKLKAEDRLKEQWKKTGDEEISKLEEKYKKVE